MYLGLNLAACKTPPHFARFAIEFPYSCALPKKTNIAPESRPSQKEISFSNHQFSGDMLVSGEANQQLVQWEADRSKDENQCRLAAEGALKELTNCPQSGSGENGAVKQVFFHALVEYSNSSL